MNGRLAREVTRRHRPLPALVLLAAAGCSSGTGTVWGKVSFDGRPLSGGTVHFLAEDGSVASCSVEPDGSYSVADVHPGLAHIGVVSEPGGRGMHSPTGERKADPRPGMAPPTPLPSHYANPKESGVTYAVRPGRQEHDISLTP
jgi:hypothetical protein